MTTSRRNFLKAASLTAAAPIAGVAHATQTPTPLSGLGGIEFSRMDLTYLDSGTMHPFSAGARKALDDYAASRTLAPDAPRYDSGLEARVLEKFARLINADPSEVAYVQSTTAGEQLVTRALGLPERGAHVVTDTMHFFGSFYYYEEIAKLGVDVTWVRPRDNRIHLDDLAAAIRPGTRLVAISAVSTYNGFTHDLAKVCEIAHAKGALVYADIIHAAGCVPLDVRATNVDFAACASYKWLMGDFGLGFLYTRRDLQHKIRRPQFGYEQIIGSTFRTHVYPSDPAGSTIADYQLQDSATGLFAMGTHSFTTRAMLDYSLDYLNRVGVKAIGAHAKPLTDALKLGLAKKGFTVVTPAESPAPIVTCLVSDPVSLKARLDAAKIKVTLGHNRMRVTPSVFNTMTDIEKLLAVVGQ